MNSDKEKVVYNYDEDFYAFTVDKQKSDVRMMERIHGSILKIPADVVNIIELGCGSGEVTNLLNEKFNIVGIDISIDRLKHVKAKTVKADIAHVPFRGSSFDLVLCASVLEHLSNHIFYAAIKEIVRLTRKYMLITVPDGENLNSKVARCPKCSFIFHAHGHLQSFSRKRIRYLFPDFKLISLSIVGQVKTSAYSPLLLKLRQHIFDCWFYNEELRCPVCHNTEFYKQPYIVMRMFSLINRIIHPHKKLHDGYLVALFLKS